MRLFIDGVSLKFTNENKKFQYKLIRKGAMVSLFSDSITSFGFSGVVSKCDKINRGDMSSFMEKCLAQTLKARVCNFWSSKKVK